MEKRNHSKAAFMAYLNTEDERLTKEYEALIPKGSFYFRKKELRKKTERLFGEYLYFHDRKMFEAEFLKWRTEGALTENTIKTPVKDKKEAKKVSSGK